VAYLDQLFCRAGISGTKSRAGGCSPSRDSFLPDEIYLRLPYARTKKSVGAWYEARGFFVFEKEEVEPMTGFVMKYYRWMRKGSPLGPDLAPDAIRQRQLSQPLRKGRIRDDETLLVATASRSFFRRCGLMEEKPGSPMSAC